MKENSRIDFQRNLLEGTLGEIQNKVPTGILYEIFEKKNRLLFLKEFRKELPKLLDESRKVSLEVQKNSQKESWKKEFSQKSQKKFPEESRIPGRNLDGILEVVSERMTEGDPGGIQEEVRRKYHVWKK